MINFIDQYCNWGSKLSCCVCRELAHQIAEQFRVLGKPIGLRDLVITGGRGLHLAVVFSDFLLSCAKAYL